MDKEESEVLSLFVVYWGVWVLHTAIPLHSELADSLLQRDGRTPVSVGCTLLIMLWTESLTG